MPSTVTFDVTSAAKPSITVNHMKYALYKHTDLATMLLTGAAAPQSFAPPHLQRTVTFPGLERTNYRFRLLEVLPDDLTIVRELLYTDFVPGAAEPIWHAPIEIQVDVTPGVVNGTTTFVFDGTSGTYDWRGRQIYVERVGQGTMYKTVQYTWDPVTGTFTITEDGVTFQPSELFNVEFGLELADIAGVPAQSLFTGVMKIEVATVLTAADIGKKIIIKGISSSFDITLPDIALCPENVPTYFESGIGNHVMVRVKTTSGQIIDWLKGSRTDMKLGLCESFSIYKNVDGSAKWRIHEADGNYRTVGRIVTTDGDPTANEFNALLCDGSTYNVAVYSRLYEDFVQKLPVPNVCSYADHGLLNNKYKFSYSSGGLAYLPDLRNIYLRNWDGANLAGDFMEMMMEEHRHRVGYADGIPNGVAGYGRDTGETGIIYGLLNNASTTSRGLTDKPARQIDLNNVSLTRADGSAISGSETRPKTRVILFYVLI